MDGTLYRKNRLIYGMVGLTVGTQYTPRNMEYYMHVSEWPNTHFHFFILLFTHSNYLRTRNTKAHTTLLLTLVKAIG